METKTERKRRLNKEWMKRDYDANPDKYRKKGRDWWEADEQRRSKVNAARKDWYNSHPENQILINAKSRAKRNGLVIDIDLSDIIIPKYCPITGLELVRGPGKIHDASPTLDRVDNAKGYIKGNVAVISNRANKHKGNLSMEEIKQLYLYMKEYTNDC